MSFKLNHDGLDRLKELFNIGAGNAANTLSGMIGERVMISVPEVHIFKLNECASIFGEIERQMVGIYHDVSGWLKGRMLLLLSVNSSDRLAQLLHFVCLKGGYKENERNNTLKEFSNILVGSYLNTLAEMGNNKSPVIHSVPLLAEDMIGSLLDGVLAKIMEKKIL